MKIKLDETTYLNSDSCCYWLTQMVYPSDKKPYERRVSGYMPTFKGCVESYIENKIKSSEAAQIVRLKNEIEDLKSQAGAWHEKKSQEPGDLSKSWIPCEERFPDANEMVLVTTETKKGIKSVNRAYRDENYFWHGTGSMAGVIAWMPLPLPYEPSQTD